MSTKAKIKNVLAEAEAHENRGWLEGYAEGLATREQEVKVLQEALAARNKKIREPELPEPDWLDARAVLARHVEHAPDSRPSLWVNLGDGMWGHAETTKRAETWDLCDVTPLYPKDDA